MDKLIKAREFCERTGLTKADVYRYIRSGVIRGVQPGGKGRLVFIYESEVDRILSGTGVPNEG